MASYNFAMPFFGTIASGAAGALVCLTLTALGAYTAWASYKLKPSGWWTAIVITVTFIISTAMTFSKNSLIDYYEIMDFPEQQMVILRQMEFSGWIMIAPMITGGVVLLSYLLYAKRFFKAEQ